MNVVLEKITKPFRKIKAVTKEVFNPPKRPEHFEIMVRAESYSDCLRKLEKEADLPRFDLDTKDNGWEVGFFPAGGTGVAVSITSKSSTLWKKEKTGYVSGQLVTLDHARDWFGERMTHIGRLHVSKNCPGVFRDDICTTCGYKLGTLQKK